MLAAIDHILGDRFGIGKEFEKGIMMLGIMMLSMTGMIIISPALADLLEPMIGRMSGSVIDPSVIPAALFANDMGGAPLAIEMGNDPQVASFNALVVSAMMGCTISFNIPLALSVTEKGQHKDVLIGLMCGIITIPVGCAVAGIVCGLPTGKLLWNLMPLTVLALLLAVGLLKIPEICVKIFGILGKGIKVLIIVGLALGILRFLTGIEVIKGLATLEEGAAVCLNASAVMTGAFPLMYVLSKLFRIPLKLMGKKLGMNETSAMGIFSSLATNVTTFGVMKEMDRKGVVLNCAFAVSASFVFAGHLAFTMAFDAEYVGAMIIGKLVSGAASLAVAMFISGRLHIDSGIDKA